MKKSVILIALFLITASLFGCNRQSSINQTNQSTKEMADWKEYQSADLGISFKYPKNYVFMDRFNDEEKSILIGDKNFPNPEIAPGYYAPITLSKYNESLINDILSTLSKVKEESLIIDGKKARVITGNYQDYPAPDLPANNHMRIIAIPDKNIMILSQDVYSTAKSDWNEISSTLNKILTTIKFYK